MNGEITSTGSVTLGSLSHPVIIQGDVSIAGTLTAGNIDGSGNSYPSNPSVHSITVTNTATATTVKTNNLNSTDGAPIDI